MARTGTALAAAGAAAGAALLLARPLATFGRGLWGPEDAWVNGDFLGAYWLFWSAGRPGDELALTQWPDGALPLAHHFPNPFDALLLGPLVARAPFPLWWNAMQLAHHLANVAAAAWLARALGARPAAALAGAALVAASPVMLHEIAGGRTLSGAAWAGLAGLALLLRGRAVLAGLAIGVQGLLYAYTGALCLAVGALLRPRAALRALPVVAALWLPYLWWLRPVLAALRGEAPPAGPTPLPLAGLLGLGGVPERFQLHPLLLAAGLAGVLAARRWRLGAAVLLALAVALGPRPEVLRGHPLGVPGPLAPLLPLSPLLARLHHPVRAALVLSPLLGAGAALALDRLPRRLPAAAAVLAALLAAGAARPRLERAVPWDVDPVPPGVEAARWLARHGSGAVVDLTGDGGPALGLQPVHGLPMLEGLRREPPRPDRRDGRLRAEVDRWLAGERRPDLVPALCRAGFRHVLAVERPGRPVPRAVLEADLGPPVAPGVHALSCAGAGGGGEREPGKWGREP